MATPGRYEPGSARGGRAIKPKLKGDDNQWTLILVRNLSHAREKVWRALTQSQHLHEWAPFDAEEDLTTVKLTWTGTNRVTEATVTLADEPRVLEYGDLRWELDPFGDGTRLTLWHKIDRRFISWSAAGWHICFDVLDQLLAGQPIGRLAGADAMQLHGWKRLVAEYASEFDRETETGPA